MGLSATDIVAHPRPKINLDTGAPAWRGPDSLHGRFTAVGYLWHKKGAIRTLVQKPKEAGMVLMTSPAFHLMLERKASIEAYSTGDAEMAKRAAEEKWILETEPVEKEGFCVFPFSHPRLRGIHFVVTMRPDHPNADEFLKIGRGGIVEFKPLARPVRMAPRNVLASYLRVKSVSRQ